MKTLEWFNEFEFAVDGVKFKCSVGDYTGRTTHERFELLKDRQALDQYAEVFASSAPKNILEFGIFQGGSPALFSLWFEAEKFVGVDICQPVAAFDDFCRNHPVGQRIRSYYGVSQTDRERIEEIVRSEFGPRPIDLVIDDASHVYSLSRRTFEIAFPLLRPGGTYVLEDWGWAHWAHYQEAAKQYFAAQTPLSALLMELTMLCASRPDLISEIRVFPEFAFIRKSMDAKPIENFSLDGTYFKGNLEILGAQHLNLPGVSRLIATRLLRRPRRRLQRWKQKLRRLTSRREPAR